MAEGFFNKDDLRNLFPTEKKEDFEIEFEPIKPSQKLTKPLKNHRSFPWKIALKFTGLFAGIFVLTFITINLNAITKNIDYFWKVQIQKKPYQQVVAAPTPLSTFDPTTSAQLIIPKIGINAPIIWNVDENQTNEKLLEGVTHFKGTALPGQKGNIFITGHSSYYSWVVSPYKDIFALLEKLSPGDQIYIQYQGNNFTYVVNNTKVVSPNELSVLEPTSDFNLTLMTCVPVGTNLNRLIVTSTQTTTN